VGIGIQESNAGIGIPASIISVRYRIKKMPDCVILIRYRAGPGIVIDFQSGTGLTGCRTIRHYGIQICGATKLEKYINVYVAPGKHYMALATTLQNNI
jgi:hypothetical protein